MPSFLERDSRDGWEGFPYKVVRFATFVVVAFFYRDLLPSLEYLSPTCIALDFCYCLCDATKIYNLEL